jgi:molybdopterin molybdotransferase
MLPKQLAYTNPDDALKALAEKLTIVGIERKLGTCTGRVLAEDITADRDSPAADVSAMDGYAIRLRDLQANKPIRVSGECVPGAPPAPMVDGSVVRIFTGAIVPAQADAVIKREDTEELSGEIRLRESTLKTQSGEHIRRAGENAKANSTVMLTGEVIGPAQRAMIAHFGYHGVDVHLPVRVSIITTGDEVGLFLKEQPKPWQLYNSNRYSLSSILDSKPWISIASIEHCVDNRESLTQMLGKCLQDSDAVIMTGGVSMGDYDHVPDSCRDAGGEVVFHGLPIRPGKPILGAATREGKLILGLPGNPVSATVCCRKFALPLLSKLSGQRVWQLPVPMVGLKEFGTKTLPLYWLRLVRLTENGIAELVDTRGSGDLVSLAHSDGFIECSPNMSGGGPWPYYVWPHR